MTLFALLLQEAPVSPMPWYGTVLLSFIATIPLLVNAWMHMRKLDAVKDTGEQSKKLLEGTASSLNALHMNIAAFAKSNNVSQG